VLLAVATTGDGSPALFEVTDGAVTWTPTPGVDPLLRFATVHFEAAEAHPLTLDAGPALVRLADVAAVAVTAIQVGAAGAALERTRRYLLEREQFGRSLGSFQALKHRMADLLVLVETARSVSWAAAWAAARDEPLGRPAAVAKAWCTDAFNRVAAEMVQLHGGIAITWEHDAHLFFKRAHATAQLFGRAHEHRRRLLDHLPAGQEHR
jgi:alkylation response protein AidB-like acyl-CoA dehydrogenase